MTEPSLPAQQPTAPDGDRPRQSRGAPMGSPARRPPGPDPVQYKGEDLDPARGPGLGCFYVQLVVLVVLLVVTPLSVNAGAPPLVSVALLIAIIVLLLFAGQTTIFLLRLVAAERGRRRPLAARSRTVGDLEEAATAASEPAPDDGDATRGSGSPPMGGADDAPAHGGSVRE